MLAKARHKYFTY